MKVCLMTSVYALSETDRNGSFLVESTRHLKERGHDVHVFAPSYEGCPSHTVHGVPVYRFRYFLRRWEHLTHGEGAPNRIRNPFYFVMAAFYIMAGLWHAVRFCRRERFDLIHVHWPFPHGIWGYVAGKASGTPMVLTFHGAEILLARRFPFIRPVLRHALRHARAVICNSSYTAAAVRDLLDVPVHVIPFGVTIEPRPGAKPHDKPEREILFAGRLIPRKGVDCLLRALPRVLEQVPARLHIVGTGGQAQRWRELAEDLGLSEAVVFHGLVSNECLEALYARADVFVLPAVVDRWGDTEGLGVVLVEALAFATPVVASNVGGIPDVVQDGETGLLVPPGEPEALAAAIVLVLTHPELAERVAERGLARAQSYFDWGRITGCMEAVYAGAVA